MSQREYDVAVIGAGPAGAVAAGMLCRAGLSVGVFERSEFPRFVIGESLLPRCMEALEEAGLLEAVQRQEYLVKRGALFIEGDKRRGIRFDQQFSKGWTYAWQVPRAHFDNVLIEAVAAAGAEVHFEHTVTGVEVGEHPSLMVATKNGESVAVRCRFIVDASGYGRVLPRLLGLDLPSSLAPRRAVFTHVAGAGRPPGAEDGRTWVSVREGAWLWSIPFAGDRTSVGIVAEPHFFERFPKEPWDALRAIIANDPVSRQYLSDVEPLQDVGTIDGYGAAVSKMYGPGFVLVGNATEFLDPIFSSGVTLATESARMAARAIVRQLEGEQVDWQKDYVEYMERGIDVFRTYVMAWYEGSFRDVLFAKDPRESITRMITSVLAGYVWDLDNAFVREHGRKLKQLVDIIRRTS